MPKLSEMIQRPSQSNVRIPGLDLSPKLNELHTSHLSKGYELVFNNIHIKADKKEILKDIYGFAKPGELVAIMGPSGAGKSTLLNAIAGRITLDRGSVTLNSHHLSKQLRRKISYVLQDDVFLAQLTFWETIWYTALLRLPESMPTEEKKRRVYEIIDGLDMRKCLKTKIGDPMNRGLSGGEKKRANIACELLTNPALMLLDEPTSGLDSASAYSLMSSLKSFAQKSGKTVVATIHQPSSQIFNMFDRLLLLCDGKVAYFGGIENCAAHFESIGLRCGPHYNLADFILDAVKDVSEEIKLKIFDKAQEKRLCETNIWQSNRSATPPPPYNDDADNAEKGLSSQTNGAFDTIAEEPGEVKFSDLTSSEDSDDEEDDDSDVAKYKAEYSAKWPTGFWLQYKVLAMRNFKQALPRVLARPNVIQNVVVSVFTGLLWFQTKAEENYLSDRLGLEFFTLIYLAFIPLLDALGSFPIERPVVNKERLAGYYRLSAYYLAKTTTELPLVLILPTSFHTITFWMAGLNRSFLVYLQQLGLLLLSSSAGQALGLVYGALILDVTVAFLCATTTTLACMLAGGFYVQNIPFWASWLQYLSFLQYSYYATLSVDFTNTQFSCASIGSKFCTEIHQTNTTNTTSEFTPVTRYIPPQVLLDHYTKSDEGWQIWHYACMLLLISIVLRLLAYITLRFIRKPASAQWSKKSH